jgi:hypothetical protein
MADEMLRAVEEVVNADTDVLNLAIGAFVIRNLQRSVYARGGIYV